MAFKSDRQRKGFFARITDVKSDVIPQVITQSKAEKIIKDQKIGGKKLTLNQKRFFRFLAKPQISQDARIFLAKLQISQDTKSSEIISKRIVKKKNKNGI